MAVLLPRADISAAADFGCIPSSPELGSNSLSLGITLLFIFSYSISCFIRLDQCVSVEEQNRSFPSGLDCLKMYVYPDVLQMLCFCHNKQYNKLFSFSGGIEVTLHVE